ATDASASRLRSQTHQTRARLPRPRRHLSALVLRSSKRSISVEAGIVWSGGLALGPRYTPPLRNVALVFHSSKGSISVGAYIAWAGDSFMGSRMYGAIEERSTSRWLVKSGLSAEHMALRACWLLSTGPVWFLG